MTLSYQLSAVSYQLSAFSFQPKAFRSKSHDCDLQVLADS
jgi:hypothetical protein